MPIRVAVADDHEIYVEGLARLLKKQPDIELVGEASNGKELVSLVERVKPDVVLTDIKMPVMDGIKATEILKKSNPDLQIIALTNYEEDQIIIDMLDAGATGYLMKNSNASEIVDAINAVYKQTFYYCGHTSATLARLIANRKFNPYKKKADFLFSEKELEIIRLICSDYSNAEIGEKLSLSTRTIEGYRAKIMEKMNVKSNVGIVVYSIKNNIYSL